MIEFAVGLWWGGVVYHTVMALAAIRPEHGRLDVMIQAPVWPWLLVQAWKAGPVSEDGDV